MANVKQKQQMIPFVTCEIAFGSNVGGKLVLVSMYLIWILESKLIRSNNQSRATLWGPGNMSLLRCPQTHTTKLLDAKIGRWREQDQHYPNHDHSSRLLTPVIRVRANIGLPRSIVGLNCVFKNRNNQIPQKCGNPVQSQSSVQRDEFQILSNCAKRQFASFTSNLLEQMYDFRRCTMFLQKWISNLQDLPRSQRSWKQSQSALPSSISHHDNIVCIHLCDEYMKSVDSGVCHKPWSILLWIVRAYLLTIKI